MSGAGTSRSEVSAESKDPYTFFGGKDASGNSCRTLSTLHDFVKAMAGELKITAKFPEGTVEITQFEDVKKAAAGKE